MSYRSRLYELYQDALNKIEGILITKPDQSFSLIKPRELFTDQDEYEEELFELPYDLYSKKTETIGIRITGIKLVNCAVTATFTEDESINEGEVHIAYLTHATVFLLADLLIESEK